MKPLVFNTTHKVINRLLSQFNLKWDDDCLIYSIKLNHDVVEIEVSPDFNDVLKLLGLPKDIGANIGYDAHMIATSRYFSWKVLKRNRDEIQPILDVLNDYDYKSSKYTKNGINVIKSLKKHLKLDISYLIWTILPNNYSKKEIRNKFNGNLVKNWLNTKDIELTTDAIVEFKKYIKGVDYNCFDYYLYNTSPKQVRRDFLNFSKDALKYNTYFNELPF